MTEILQVFGGNPLASAIGKKIEAATKPELESEDWALNLEICDMINESDVDAKDAVRAIKKRLQQIEQDRNFTITNRTLTVLETCINNCSHRFHLLVMSKDFVQDLVKLIGPKNNPPIDLQERVLRMIERWSEAFRAQPDLSGVVTVYNDLKAKGVTFPPKDPSTEVPIQTPQRSVPPLQPILPPANIRADMVEAVHQQNVQPLGPVVLEGEGYDKITRDLSVVQTSIEMFNEILELLDAKNEASDWELAADLNTTCRKMKERIVDLIERVENEDLTIELLRLNDDLNNIFTRYDRSISKRLQAASLPMGSTGPRLENIAVSSEPILSTRVARPIQTKTENELSLIDFNAGDGSDSATKEPTNNPPSATIDPFDSDAVSRAMRPTSSSQPKVDHALVDNLSRLNIGPESVKTNQKESRKPGLPEEISSVREQDFAEIENWLSTDLGHDSTSRSGGDLPSIEPISIPNSEFENFIATRALAGSATSAQQQQQKRNPESSDN